MYRLNHSGDSPFKIEISWCVVVDKNLDTIKVDKNLLYKRALLCFSRRKKLSFDLKAALERFFFVWNREGNKTNPLASFSWL